MVRLNYSVELRYGVLVDIARRVHAGLPVNVQTSYVNLIWQGDAVAHEIVRDTARYLGAGIANILNFLNVDTIVIAGGVTAAGEALFAPLRAEVRRRAFKPAVDAARIVAAELPGTAGVVGAVATFKAQVLGAV